MPEAKVWRGQTLHDRSVGRRDELLRAGEILMGSQGAAAATMRAVCRQANLSPKYFYESFANPEALLIAVYDSVEQRLLDHIVEKRLGANQLSLESVLELCADFFEANPGAARVLLREPLGNDVLRAHSASRAGIFIKALTPLLAAEVPDVDDDEMAALSTCLSGALIALYLDWSDGRLQMPRAKVADAAVRVVAAIAGAARATG